MNTVHHLLKMKGSQVWQIAPGASVLDGLKLMAEKGTGSLLVVEGEQVVGIFTERDYARKVGFDGRKPDEFRIAEVMTPNLILIRPDQTVRDCMQIMTDSKIRHLPVMEDGRLVGIISIGDVVKDMIDELEFHVEQLSKYIAGLR